MQDFRALKVWEKSHQLTLAVYKATGPFPRDELYGLTRQVRRACGSIPANIAEGCGRGTVPEMAYFLQVAMGSASELEYHLLLARDLDLLADTEYQDVATRTSEVKRMLTALIKRLKASR